MQAKLKAASLGSTRSDAHPFVIAAKEQEENVLHELHRELPVAMASLELELSVGQDRSAALQQELQETRTKLGDLAEHRAEYSNLVAAVAQQTRLVETAEKQLAEARAHQAGAQTGNVLSRLDQVEQSVNPVGPGRTTTALAGGVAGLMLGLGVLFTFYSPNGTTKPQAPTTASREPFGYQPTPAAQKQQPVPAQNNTRPVTRPVITQPAAVPAAATQPVAQSSPPTYGSRTVPNTTEAPAALPPRIATVSPQPNELSTGYGVETTAL